MTAKERREFHDKMRKEGWRPLSNLWGFVIKWKHEKTEAVVTNEEAVQYYTTSGGESPVPF